MHKKSCSSLEYFGQVSFYRQDPSKNENWDVYEFGYADNNGERNEARDIYGVVTGSFNYVDDAGLAQTVRYKADKGGFQVLDTTVPVVAPISGPQPVQYTPEVLAAREAHLK